jgi:hypothetical protein
VLGWTQVGVDFCLAERQKVNSGLNQPTLDKLHALRLQGMAEAFRAQAQQANLGELSFEERFALLVDQEWAWRQNRVLASPSPKPSCSTRAVLPACAQPFPVLNIGHAKEPAVRAETETKAHRGPRRSQEEICQK